MCNIKFTLRVDNIGKQISAELIALYDADNKIYKLSKCSVLPIKN